MELPDVMDYMRLLPPIHMLKSSPIHVMASGDGALGGDGVMRADPAWQWGQHLSERDPEELSDSHHRARAQREGGGYDPGKNLCQTQNPRVPGTWTSQPSRTVRNKCLSYLADSTLL